MTAITPVTIDNLESLLEKQNTTLQKRNLSIIVPERDKRLLPINIKMATKYPICEINTVEYQFITAYKNKINTDPYHSVWDQYKKFSNRFELVHMPNNKKKNHDSIAFYIPLSRSFFKLWEIILDFDLLPKDSAVTTGHIAEGPGGFMEAWVRARERQLGYCDDSLHGITLVSSKREIPGWEKMNYFIKSYQKNIKIGYGSDGTGDIYQVHNIRHFVNQTGPNSCYLVTADGGFDFSVDFIHQEQMAYKLIFSEILIAISIQKQGGVFICKLFDSFTYFTVKLIWLLNCVYREVIITKPVTSRPANSEKYLLCRDFQGIDPQYLEKLYQTLFSWDQLEYTGGNYKVVDIFSESSVPPLYLNIISQYNSFNVKKQLSSIMETLYWIEKKLDNHTMDEITKKQVEIAIQWCFKYHTVINYRSHYLESETGFRIKQSQQNQKLNVNDFFTI